MIKFLWVVFVIVMVIVTVLFPFATIWGLNTLFTLSIPYTFWTWLAVVLVQSAIYSIRK